MTLLTATLDDDGPRARLMLDYERRAVAAPEGGPAAAALLNTLGDRVSGQLVVVL